MNSGQTCTREHLLAMDHEDCLDHRVDGRVSSRKVHTLSLGGKNLVPEDLSQSLCNCPAVETHRVDRQRNLAALFLCNTNRDPVKRRPRLDSPCPQGQRTERSLGQENQLWSIFSEMNAS